MIFCVLIVLIVSVGCSEEKKDEDLNKDNSISKENDDNNNENSTTNEKDEITEKDLVKSLIEESKKHLDTLPKEEDFMIHIDQWDEYRHEWSIDEGEKRIDITTSINNLEIEFEGQGEEEEEDYELSSGLLGKIGYIDDGYLGFIGATGEVRTDIVIGEVGMEEAKRILDSLKFRDEDITEAELKETTGVDYENVKYFNNIGTGYDVSEMWFRTADEGYVAVRYRNKDAGEYDAIDVYVSENDFIRDGYKDTVTVQTEQGKKVDIMDDGFFVEWFWEDNGSKYSITGNFSEEEKDKKDYMLEVIDNMTKVYGG